MKNTVSLGAVVIVLVLSTACENSVTVPTAKGAAPTVPAPTPPPTRAFPPLSGPSRTFTFQHELSHGVSAYTRDSRFVLFDSGGFVLRYDGLAREYRGGYTEANGNIAFEWEGWSSAGPWGARGILQGDELTVQYNVTMQLTDFEDAVYAQMP